ncbi:LysM peptidoglycan-binding domain-containing protein [Anaerosolibacter sp.]|uniref:LysM peptidoglycan-binding domain-containing protein n=1 Tax=Anaerosolibacter sp. TaxID=1872527 RepID=UPI0039F010C9
MVMFPRKPTNCPPDAGRYTVRPGDVMYRIARNYQMDLNQLLEANPHISHPGLIVPGDVLCIPKIKLSPYCTILQPVKEEYSTASGTAMVSKTPNYEKSVSIIAVLPGLETLNDNYKQYEAYLIYTTPTDNRALNKPLHKVPETPNTWAATIDLTPEDIKEIPRNVKVVISATRTEYPEPPPGDLIILEGNISRF